MTRDPADLDVGGALTESTPAARVLDAAIAIARGAPMRRGTYVSYAKIYWPRIEELRDALDALGVEWRRQ